MKKKQRLKDVKKSQKERGKSCQTIAAFGISESSQRVIFIILLCSIFAVGVALRFQNLITDVKHRSPDEMVYTMQADIIAQQGTQGIKQMVREYNVNEKLWHYPPPARVGYLLPLAAVMKITKSADVKVGTHISRIFSIISLIVLIVFGLRVFNPWVTLYALLFMSVSPLSLAIARRTWQEAMLGCIGLLLVYLSCEITKARHKIVWYIPFVILGSCIISIKLSGWLTYALCITWILTVLIVEGKSISKGALFVAGCTLGIAISLFYLVTVAGGVSAVKDVLKHMGKALETSNYARQYCSGPWYEFFGMAWLLIPLNTILFFVGLAGIFLYDRLYQKVRNISMRDNRNALYGITFFVIAYMIMLFVAKQYPQNLRYVSVLYVPFYLISGLGLWYIMSFLNSKMNSFWSSVGVVSLSLLLVVAAANDYRKFKTIIVETGIKDMSIGLLRMASREN